VTLKHATFTVKHEECKQTELVQDNGE